MAAVESATKYDLISRMGPFFDRHLVVPIYEFLADRKIYDDKDLLKAKYELLKHTNMVDYQIEVYCELHNIDPTTDLDKVPRDLQDKRDKVVSRLRDSGEEIEAIATILESAEVVELLNTTSRERDTKPLIEALCEKTDFDPEMMNTMYEFAKFKFNIGDYAAAKEFLYYYKLLTPLVTKSYLSAFWGKFAAEILTQDWEKARDDLMKLRGIIDSTTFDTEIEQVQQRAWLLHWALYVFHNHPKGRDDIIEVFLMQPAYLNCIQILCPHILRYLTCAVVINQKRRQCLKELVKVIVTESNTYRDPITEFIECLYVNYDFDKAQLTLRECEEVLKNDFFLVDCLDEFIDSARLLIFEMYCRIHEVISIDSIAEKLNMGREEAERWIVNLIRNANLDAKIDSKLGHVIMGTRAQSVYEQVAENTKMLSLRAQALAYQIEKITPGEQWGPRQWQGNAASQA